VKLAQRVGIRTVIVPTAPGVFSAFGMLFSDLRYDFVRTWPTRLDDASFAGIERIYGALEGEGRRAIAAASVTPEKVTVRRAFDIRYVGQEHAVMVDLPMRLFGREDRAAIKRHFDDMHLVRYGTSAPAERAEIVSLRTTVTGIMTKPKLAKIARGTAAPPRHAATGRRRVYFAGRDFVETRTYARAALLAGNRIAGPASKLALPSIWRKYHCPLDSPAMSVLVNFSAPSGKCPQKITASVQMLRITLATMLAFSVDVKVAAGDTEVNAGNAT